MSQKKYVVLACYLLFTVSFLSSMKQKTFLDLGNQVTDAGKWRQDHCFDGAVWMGGAMLLDRHNGVLTLSSFDYAMQCILSHNSTKLCTKNGEKPWEKELDNSTGYGFFSPQSHFFIHIQKGVGNKHSVEVINLECLLKSSALIVEKSKKIFHMNCIGNDKETERRVQMSDDERYVVVAEKEGRICCIDLKTDKINVFLSRVTHVCAVGFSRSGKYVCVSNKKEIAFFDIEKLIQKWKITRDFVAKEIWFNKDDRIMCLPSKKQWLFIDTNDGGLIHATTLQRAMEGAFLSADGKKALLCRKGPCLGMLSFLECTMPYWFWQTGLSHPYKLKGLKDVRIYTHEF